MDPAIKPAKILLIDADPVELKRLSTGLSAAGFEPIGSPSTDAAIRAMAAVMPDLILLGACAVPACAVPALADPTAGVDGRPALLEILRPWGIPMIVLQQPGAEHELPGLLAAGACDCLARHATRAELHARLGAHLSLGRLELQVETANQRLAREKQERRNSERLLRESEEIFGHLAGAVNDALVVMNCLGRVLVWNPAAERIFGYAKEEILGHDLHDFLVPEGIPRPQPADFNRLYITHAAEGHGPVCEVQARRKDGSVLTVELTRSPAAIAGEAVIVSIARDVTERRRMIQLIENGKREWESVVDAVDDLILLTGADGRVRRCNRTALIRLNPGGAQAPAWQDVLHQSPGALLFGGPHGDADLAALESGLTPGQEVQFPRLEGWFEATIYPIRLGGSYSMKAYLLKDVTQRKIMEAAMLASQKMASLGTLVAGVAHEINSPLQVITGVSESLLDLSQNGGVSPERLKRNLEMIHRNGARVAGLVRALRLYAHTSDHSFRPDHLNEVIQDTLLLIEHQLQSWSNIQVQADLAPDLPEMACDREKLAQALINLLTNARDAMPAGGEITLRTRYLPERDAVTLEVADNGQGIPPEIQARIFDPFYTTKPLGQGTGLGLSIVQGVIQSHHGEIRLESTLKEGTRFLLTFPRFQPLPEPGPQPATTRPSGRFDDDERTG